MYSGGDGAVLVSLRALTVIVQIYERISRFLENGCLVAVFMYRDLDVYEVNIVTGTYFVGELSHVTIVAWYFVDNIASFNIFNSILGLT